MRVRRLDDDVITRLYLVMNKILTGTVNTKANIAFYSVDHGVTN